MTTDPTQPEPQPTPVAPEAAPAPAAESAPAPEASSSAVVADPIAALRKRHLNKRPPPRLECERKMASGS